jgi:hypothetical protein
VTIATQPLAEEVEEVDFETAEINMALIRHLASGSFFDP